MNILKGVALFISIVVMSFLFLVGLMIFTPLGEYFPFIRIPASLPPSSSDSTIAQQPAAQTASVSPMLTLSTTLTTSFGETAEEAREAIKTRKIIVAASIESGPYSYRDENGAFHGFEIELARELVRRWFSLTSSDKPEEKGHLSFVGVSVINREHELRTNDNVDFLVGGVSFTEKRCVGNGLTCTTEAHFSDKHALLVHKNSVVKQYCDPALDSTQTYITVLSNTAAVTTLDSFKSECSFTQPIKLENMPSRRDAFDAVRNSNNLLKVYKTERRFLEFYIDYFEYSNELQVIVDEKNFSSETYVVWLNEKKKGMKLLIDETMMEIRNDGKFKQLCRSYFGTLEESCNVK